MTAPAETSAEYQRRATQHRPQDLRQLQAEAQRLAASGLTERDIGSALGLPWVAVQQLTHGSAAP